jgi:hypothetical protein
MTPLCTISTYVFALSALSPTTWRNLRAEAISPAAMRPYHRVYHPFSWRAWLDFGSGALGDMACHVMDAAYTDFGCGALGSVSGFICCWRSHSLIVGCTSF